MTNGIIVINSGSTSLKFGVYQPDKGVEPKLLCRGQIDEMETDPTFLVKDQDDKHLDAHRWGEGNTIDDAEALTFVINWLESNVSDLRVVGAGHRIVLGGTRYKGPTLIEEGVLNYLDELSVMEPSHQPCNVAGARAMAKVFGHLPQVCCFDTSFHRTMPDVAQTYAVPAEVTARGVRHWGYHGISYDYISRQLKKRVPKAHRVIAAHLGGGASMCAILDGRSIDTSMGFAGLSGLPMATRAGDLPPDIVLYLLRTKAYNAEELEKLLYHKSGLLGLSGISSDMRTLLESNSPQAALAVEYFIYQVVKYAGAYAALLGGLDAFVFTAGIGENSVPIRKTVCKRLGFLGVELDEVANARHGPLISTSASKVSVWVIPTNEELMIASHTIAVLRKKGFLQ